MVKGGNHPPLCKLKGIMNATPIQKTLNRGSLDGKGGKNNHPLILTLERFTSLTELIFVGKKIRKKKS
jgi:hypothetical protein